MRTSPSSSGRSSCLRRVNVLKRRTEGRLIRSLCSHSVKAIRLQGASATAQHIEGRVVVHDLGPDLRKGTVLGEEHLQRVREAGEVHLVELERGDVHEDEAASRLAAAIAGPGLEPTPAMQSQVRLVSARRGLVRVKS